MLNIFVSLCFAGACTWVLSRVTATASVGVDQRSGLLLLLLTWRHTWTHLADGGSVAKKDLDPSEPSDFSQINVKSKSDYVTLHPFNVMNVIWRGSEVESAAQMRSRAPV